MEEWKPDSICVCVCVCDHWPGCVLGGSTVLGGASVVLYMAVSERSDGTETIRSVHKSYVLKLDKYKCKTIRDLNAVTADIHSSLVYTWLKGDLTEQHPGISKVELTLDSTGHVIGQVDGDEAGAGVLLVHHRAEGERRGLPVWIGAEVAHHLAEGLDVPWEHVVAVDLDAHERHTVETFSAD